VVAMKYWFRRLLVLFILLAVVVGGVWGVLQLRGVSEELVFVAGFHNAITGEEVEAVFDVAAEDTVILVVNFWASWCPHCNAEAPALQKAHRYYQASYGTEVVLVGLNVGESDRKVKDFAKKHGLTFPLIGGFPAEQYTSGVPMTVVFRRTEDDWVQVGQRDGEVEFEMLADTVDVVYAENFAAE
jgi:thiol-disulfide isomerase/thioredoxin